jgi:glucoamylase
LLVEGLSYGSARPAAARLDLAAVAKYLFWLMYRNVASAGLVFDDPVNAGVISSPGAVLASPSWENTATHVTQDYVYHWTRDAAVVAFELAWAYADGTLPDNQPLIDYVLFSQACQRSAGDFDRACFYIDGAPRPWTNQADGPALQVLALLAMYRQLDAPTQATAAQLIDANLAFLAGAYQGQTYNLWEEEYGYSFFARSAQLRCFQAIAANTFGITVPAWLPDALSWLISALESHWNGKVYQSVLPVPTDYRAPYDPNIDIVQAAIYGAESVTDPRLLATAAQLRAQWSDPASKYFYPINGADSSVGLGPMLGRYPGDVYDGDTDAQVGDHPWALTTANFAELYYRLAAKITSSRTVAGDSLSAAFLSQVGVTSSTPPLDAAIALRSAGDAMLRAIAYHSDHFELSEQFDAVTGFEKSVANLSWSYAAFLSAVRARTSAS